MYFCTRGYFLIMLSCEGPFSTSIGEDFIIILPEQMLYANTISPKGTMCVDDGYYKQPPLAESD